MATRSIVFVAIMLFGASYAPHASANGPANTNEWFESLGLPTPPPLFLPGGQPFPQQPFQPPKFGNGMSMSSSSSSNGPGGSIITVTHNGETKTFTVGDNPPPTFEASAPKRPKKPTAPKMLNLKFPKFEPMVFKPMVFKPLVFAPIPEPKMIDPEEIRNAKPNPNKNEHFVGMSTSSFSSSVNDNGKIKTTGGMMAISNVDGKVTEKSFILNGDNEDEDGNEV